MQLTIGRIIFCFVLVGIGFLVMEITPSGDCTKLYNDQIKTKQCQTIQTLGSVIVVMIVISVLLMIIGSIFYKPEEDTPERPWSKLPKGFDKTNDGDKELE